MNFPRLSAYHRWEDNTTQQSNTQQAQQQQQQPRQLPPNAASPAVNTHRATPANGLVFPSTASGNSDDGPPLPRLHERMRALSLERAGVNHGAVIHRPVPSQAGSDDTIMSIASSFVGPSEQYLAFSSAPSMTLPAPRDPRLLILDLNGTLLVRLPRTPGKQRDVRQRPYLRPFLEYLFHADLQGGTPWRVMVWSSATPYNVEDMVTKAFGEYKDQLLAVWARDTLGLTAEQYAQKTQTTKDLAKVWSQLSTSSGGLFSATNTILLDDSALKAHLQPHNHVPLLEYSYELHLRDMNRLSSPEASPDGGAPVDQHLIAVVGVLNAIVHESRACGWISAGGLWTGRYLAKQEEIRRLKTLAIKEKMQRELEAANAKQSSSAASSSSSPAPATPTNPQGPPVAGPSTTGGSSSLPFDATADSKRREEELREKLRQMMSAKRQRAPPPLPTAPSDPDSDAEMDEVEGLLFEGVEGGTGTGDSIPGERASLDIWYEDPVNLAYWVQKGMDVLKAKGIAIDPGSYDVDIDNEPDSGAGGDAGPSHGGGKKKGKGRARQAAQTESDAFLDDLLQELPGRPGLGTAPASSVPPVPMASSAPSVPAALVRVDAAATVKIETSGSQARPSSSTSATSPKNQTVAPSGTGAGRQGPRKRNKGRGRGYTDRDRPTNSRNQDNFRTDQAVTSPTNVRFPSLADTYVPAVDQQSPRDRDWERDRDRDYARERDRDYGPPVRYSDRPSRYDRDRDYWRDEPADYYLDYDRAVPSRYEDDRLPYGGPGPSSVRMASPPRASETYGPPYLGATDEYGRDLYGYALTPAPGLGPDLDYGPNDLGYRRPPLSPPRYDPDEWIHPSGGGLERRSATY